MFHRSQSLMTFVQKLSNYPEIYQTSLANRHFSISILSKFNQRYNINLISSCEKIIDNKQLQTNWESRCNFVTTSIQTLNNNDNNQNNIKQKIVELCQDNLGQLKERALDTGNEINLTGESTAKKEETPKQDASQKKGKGKKNFNKVMVILKLLHSIREKKKRKSNSRSIDIFGKKFYNSYKSHVRFFIKTYGS